jgi:hypothetical protein
MSFLTLGAWADPDQETIVIGSNHPDCECSFDNFYLFDWRQGYTCQLCLKAHRYICSQSIHPNARGLFNKPLAYCKQCKLRLENNQQ